MIKSFLSAAALLYSVTTTASNDPLNVMYEGLDLKLPPNPVTVALSKWGDNALFVKYSKEKEEKRIAMSKTDIPEATTKECPADLLLHDFFTTNVNSTCPKDNIRVLSDTFIAGADNGVWEGKSHKFYYTVKANKAVVFVVKPDKSVVHIESNMHNRPQLKSLLSNYF